MIYSQHQLNILGISCKRNYIMWKVFLCESCLSSIVSVTRILYPGGSVSIISSGYQRAAKIFYKLAIEANKRGDYFPVWGICLGYEQLAVLTSGRRIYCRVLIQVMCHYIWTTNGMALGHFSQNRKLRKRKRCSLIGCIVTHLSVSFRLLTQMRTYDFPISGTRWHPEKNAFEWGTTFYMAEFFVHEARKNYHRFEFGDEESKVLIYNCNPVYSGPRSTFEQKDFFLMFVCWEAF
uniref:folate gamma-glutamyl hydrolase n=1 Tax=Sander lucioperca TaxID=283035 RepID=A0A8C9Y0X2_SANLU